MANKVRLIAPPDLTIVSGSLTGEIPPTLQTLKVGLTEQLASHNDGNNSLHVRDVEVITRSLSALLFQVDPRDPAILAAGAALLAATVLVACAVPAVRAVRVNPRSLLREE